ncbi:MAG: hypothetical protein GDA53_02330 [Rhodobacteraceae bacterium]|nr:hypothetical protein [Paracoccaceae bacterium]
MFNITLADIFRRQVLSCPQASTTGDIFAHSGSKEDIHGPQGFPDYQGIWQILIFYFSERNISALAPASTLAVPLTTAAGAACIPRTDYLRTPPEAFKCLLKIYSRFNTKNCGPVWRKSGLCGLALP